VWFVWTRHMTNAAPVVGKKCVHAAPPLDVSIHASHRTRHTHDRTTAHAQGVSVDSGVHFWVAGGRGHSARGRGLRSRAADGHGRQAPVERRLLPGGLGSAVDLFLHRTPTPFPPASTFIFLYCYISKYLYYNIYVHMFASRFYRPKSIFYTLLSGVIVSFCTHATRPHTTRPTTRHDTRNTRNYHNTNRTVGSVRCMRWVQQRSSSRLTHHRRKTRS
jgi:hypothetical protein